MLSASFLGTSLIRASYSYSAPRDYVHKIVAGESAGSAIVIAPGYALTAAHVVRGEAPLFINGLKVVSKWFDVHKDLGLVYIPGLECPCAPLADGFPLQDTPIVTVGYPMGKVQYATEGRVQEVANENIPRLYVSSPVIFGNSGGGTFQWSWVHGWELVGVLVEVEGFTPFIQPYFITHMARIVPITTIHEFLKEKFPKEVHELE